MDSSGLCNGHVLALCAQGAHADAETMVTLVVEEISATFL
jgi:hypothetical protein